MGSTEKPAVRAGAMVRTATVDTLWGREIQQERRTWGAPAGADEKTRVRCGRQGRTGEGRPQQGQGKENEVGESRGDERT